MSNATDEGSRAGPSAARRTAALLATVSGATTFVGVLLPWYGPASERSFASLDGALPLLGLITMAFALRGSIAGGRLFAAETRVIDAPPVGRRETRSTAERTALWSTRLNRRLWRPCARALTIAAVLMAVDFFWHFKPREIRWDGRGGEEFVTRYDRRVGIYLTLGASLLGACCAWVLRRGTQEAALPPEAIPPVPLEPTASPPRS